MDLRDDEMSSVGGCDASFQRRQVADFPDEEYVWILLQRSPKGGRVAPVRLGSDDLPEPTDEGLDVSQLVKSCQRS